MTMAEAHRTADALPGVGTTFAGYRCTGTLDAVGNIRSFTSGSTTTNRTSNSLNQLTHIGNASLSYDDNGNLAVDESGRHYLYDAWNRLRAVQDSGGTLLVSEARGGTGWEV
jgi:hypothetical protein